MNRKILSAVALAMLALSSVANAAEGESNLFAGDIGNAVWTLVIFVLVIVVLGKFAWTPLLEALQKREDFIRDSLEEAKDDRLAAEAQLKEYEAKLATAQGEATEIIEEAKRDAETLRTRLEEKAREESENMLDRARREIGIAKQSAVKELYSTSAQLATDIAGRVLQRELTPADHERLIQESIGELENLEKN